MKKTWSIMGGGRKARQPTDVCGMPMRTLLLAVVALFSLTPASAQIMGDVRCKEPRYVNSEIREIEVTLKTLANLVETEPPGDAEYIRSEMRIALSQSNLNRYSLLTSNRFYYPLQFHDDYKVAADNLQAAREARGKDTVHYLVVVLSRLPPYELPQRADALRSSFRKGSKRGRP
jgi:hypothetical protein